MNWFNKADNRLYEVAVRIYILLLATLSLDSMQHKIRTHTKIQQTKMLVACQRFADMFLFGLVWQYSSIQKNIVKVGSKSWILTCSCHITLSLPFYTDPASKRELNFSNGYLGLLYFWYLLSTWYIIIMKLTSQSCTIASGIWYPILIFKWVFKRGHIIEWSHTTKPYKTL